MRPLPLRYRLPNPPSVFVARTPEMAAFNDAVRRSPLVVVTGPGGVGKTALVLNALHRKKRVPRTMYVDVRRGAVHDLRLELLGAVAETEGIESMNRSAFRGDADTVMAELIDLAERGPWWFVLDNLHHIEAGESRALLQTLARYARKSRWIAISCVDPQVEDDGAEVLAVSGMDPADLERMAAAWGTDDPTRVGRAIAVSGGSPWLLRQCLANGRDEAEVTREGLLDGLTSEQVDLVDALGVLDVPLPPDVLITFCPPSLEADLLALAPRGIIERTPAGVQLHEVAHRVLAASAKSSDRARWRSRAAVGLASCQDPVAALEGLRLLLELGWLGDVVSALDEGGALYLESGHAPALWRLLAPTTDPRLEGWRLRCATELGNPTALRMVLEPSHKNIEDRVAWAQTLFMQGRLDEADRASRAVLQSTTPGTDAGLAFEAALVVANCAAARGNITRAEERLTAFATSTPEDAARRNAALATYFAGTPDAARAHALADTLVNGLEALATPAREEVAYGIAHVRRLQGRLADAAAMLRAVESTPRGSELKHLVARRALWLGAVLALDRGQLNEAAESLARLTPFIRTASLFRPDILCATIALKLACGELEWLDRAIADAHREASSFGIASAVYLASALGMQLASLRALPLASIVEPPLERTAAADQLFIRRSEHQVLRAGHISEPSLERLGAIDAPGLRPLARSVCARAALFTNDEGSEALAEITSAISDAAASGHLLAQAEARLAHCDILLVLGRDEELMRSSEELARLARALGSPRFGFEAAFATAITGTGLDLAVLEHLAAQRDIAPVAARRSRILLGGVASVDAFDTKVLDALRERFAFFTPTRIGTTPFVVARPTASGSERPGWDGSGWGIDEPSRRVWLSKARWVDFGRRALHWELLLCLVAGRGRATKEELVQCVWSEPEYHPLKHDARLQVAVRKVRELIEEDPSSPERVVTTDDGYALAGIVRLVRAPSPS